MTIHYKITSFIEDISKEKSETIEECIQGLIEKSGIDPQNTHERINFLLMINNLNIYIQEDIGNNITNVILKENGIEKCRYIIKLMYSSDGDKMEVKFIRNNIKE